MDPAYRFRQDADFGDDASQCVKGCKSGQNGERSYTSWSRNMFPQSQDRSIRKLLITPCKRMRNAVCPTKSFISKRLESVHLKDCMNFAL